MDFSVLNNIFLLFCFCYNAYGKWLSARFLQLLMPCGFSVDELQLDEPFISVQISHSTEPVLKSLAVLIKDPLNLSLIRLI